MQVKHHKCIVISDVHLGTKNSGVKQLVRFLKNNSCETLILNGDIIDGWQLKKSGKWRKKHSRFLKLIIKILDTKNTRIIYIMGNHDDFLDEFLPFEFGRFLITRDYIYESAGKRFYICHGDIFDHITSQFRFIAHLGDMGYTLLLWLNRRINHRRQRKGLPYFSISQQIKHKVKQAVSFISDFETTLCSLAETKKCQGVICGHIHQPDNKFLNEIHYLNSGDWVESYTALTEDFAGNWSIVRYAEWLTENSVSV